MAKKTMEMITLLPAAVALVIAVWKKDVIVALLAALLTSEVILSQGNLLFASQQTIERTVSVFAGADNTRVILFALLIGAVMALLRSSGGVAGFVQWIISTPLASNQRRVGFLTMGSGIIIFIESNLSLLTSGMLSRALFDRFKLSRARLAFIIDSTCAPICVLILLNAWGAFLLVLIEPFAEGRSLDILLGTIIYNFYPLIILTMVFYTVSSGRVFASLKHYEKHMPAVITETKESSSHPLFFIAPLVLLIFSILGFMWITGNGNILQGSGTQAILYGTLMTLVATYLLLKFFQHKSHKQLLQQIYAGMSELLPVVITVLLALALGMSMRDLGTGDYVAGIVSQSLPPLFIAPVTFIAAAIIAFTTGTSWGTFSLLTPIAMAISQATGIDPSLVMAAVIGGGVFGDHCSPISDTTIVASLAAGVDHLTHVKTQLPYALVGGVLALAGYILVSI